MSRAFAYLGVAGAGVCGMLIAYSTLQPELEAIRAERQGEFRERHPQNDKVISEAIMSDLKEAKEQVTGVEKGGFAWGIRQAIWGKREEADSTGPSTTSVGQQTNAEKSTKH